MLLFNQFVLHLPCWRGLTSQNSSSVQSASPLLVHKSYCLLLRCCDSLLATGEHKSYPVVPTLDMFTIESAGVLQTNNIFWCRKTVSTSTEVSARRHPQPASIYLYACSVGNTLNVSGQLAGGKHRKGNRTGNSKSVGNIGMKKRRTSSTREAFASEAEGKPDGVCIDNESCAL